MKASYEEQMKQSKVIIASDLPMRALIYGQDITREQIRHHSRLQNQRRLLKQMSNIDFTLAAAGEERKVLYPEENDRFQSTRPTQLPAKTPRLLKS